MEQVAEERDGRGNAAFHLENESMAQAAQGALFYHPGKKAGLTHLSPFFSSEFSITYLKSSICPLDYDLSGRPFSMLLYNYEIYRKILPFQVNFVCQHFTEFPDYRQNHEAFVN